MDRNIKQLALNMSLLPGWFEFQGQRVYAYNAETSDRPDVGLSHGFVHYGTSGKGEDRLGFAGIIFFFRNAEKIDD